MLKHEGACAEYHRLHVISRRPLSLKKPRSSSPCSPAVRGGAPGSAGGSRIGSGSGLIVMVSSSRGELDIGPWPKSAEVSHRKTNWDAHLGVHDYEKCIPSQEGNDKYQRTAGLFSTSQSRTLTSASRLGPGHSPSGALAHRRNFPG